MRLKIVIFLFILCIGSTTVVTASSDPVLLFSDMASAPKTGWDGSATQGAAVTIWGYNLGDTRGSSYVTVNGVDLTAETDYAVWGEYWPTQYWQRITFWLNSNMNDDTGQITVTVNNQESNPLDFTIRDGNIYFVESEKRDGDGTLGNAFNLTKLTSFGRLKSGILPGDVIYFRAGTYTAKPNGGNSLLWVSKNNGTATHPYSFIAYPGEIPVFSISPSTYSSSNFHTGITLASNHLVTSGFRIDSEGKAAGVAGDHNRFIGNEVSGNRQHQNGNGIINTGNSNAGTGDNPLILGNAIHGGTTRHQQDHAIYVQGCSDNGGAKVGWNHIYNNNFGKGVLLVVNHQQNRCDYVDQILDAHFLFNNIIECHSIRSKGIGIYDLSYDYSAVVPEAEPEPAYVYNNIVVGCGVYHDAATVASYGSTNAGPTPAISHSNGHARFYHNLLYDGGYIGFNVEGRSTPPININGETYTSLRLSTILKNNILVVKPGYNYQTAIEEYINYGTAQEPTTTTLSNNLYYGLGNYTPCVGCVSDDNNINNKDPLFVDPDNGNFNLQSNSPAINASTNSLTFEVPPPAWAPINRDFNYLLRTGVYDIGPLEYGGGGVVANESGETDNNAPIIDQYSPSNLFFRRNTTITQTFEVNASDQDNNSLTYKWYANGTALSSITNTFSKATLSYKNTTTQFTVSVSDGTNTTNHSWIMTVRDRRLKDVNDDGSINHLDLRLIAKRVIKKQSFRTDYDLNQDGLMNILT